MTVGSQKYCTGHTGMGPSFPEIPMAEPYKYSPCLRPRNEGPPAAASEAARVQPFKCSQQVKLGFRFASAPLRFHYPLPGFPKP